MPRHCEVPSHGAWWLAPCAGSDYSLWDITNGSVQTRHNSHWSYAAYVLTHQNLHSGQAKREVPSERAATVNGVRGIWKKYGSEMEGGRSFAFCLHCINSVSEWYYKPYTTKNSLWIWLWTSDFIVIWFMYWLRNPNKCYYEVWVKDSL